MRANPVIPLHSVGFVGAGDYHRGLHPIQAQTAVEPSLTPPEPPLLPLEPGVCCGSVRILDPIAGSQPLIRSGRLGPRSIGGLSTVNQLQDWKASSHDASRLMDVGYLSYELGRELEPYVGVPAAPHAATPFEAWPHSIWTPMSSAPGSSPTRTGYELSAFRSASGKSTYIRGVERVLDYIRAGDVYQVNLSHPLAATFRGCARDLAADLFALASPRFGCYLELDDPVSDTRRAIISLSPELFLHVNRATRRVTTRPMKGTRPLASGRASLADSSKDQAELAMIVDLMRNDLGRVCDLGSIRVDAPHEIERHGSNAAGVLQATGTVSGTLREDLGLVDLLCQTFPAGSVTGTPKIRAMQIIQELESAPRGPYCGAIGCILPEGQAIFSVGIRTLCLTGAGPGAGMFDHAKVQYAVGAGIVADSDPEAEWKETLDKAWMLRQIAGLEDS